MGGPGNMPLPENQTSDMKLAAWDDAAQKQRRQMLIALTLLLGALILILTKDRDFWFPSGPVQSVSEPVEETSPEPKTQSAGVAPSSQPAGPAALKAKQEKVPAAAQPRPAVAPPPVVVSRAVLPPLEVEVVAGDEHRSVPAASNSVEVDLHPPSSATQASAPQTSNPAGGAVASARVHLSQSAAQILSRPVEPNYPLLAREMKIQGAVVLNALIGRGGDIQNIRVLSGPAILLAAAQEAVKKWRFRPYLQSGQAVETEARITVNFTILTQ